MTNKEKKEYISYLNEWHRQNYNNRDTNDIIGKYASLFYQLTLKITLRFRYLEKYKKRTGSPVPHYKQQGAK